MPPIELHHRIEWYAGAPFALDVLARTTCARGARRAAPADELALLLLIFARDGFPGLRLPADLAAWWDRHGSQLPDQPLRSIAEAHAALARPLATAALVAERLVGLPAAHLLDLAPAAGRRSRLAAALADPLLQHGPAGPTLVDGLLCDRRALRGWTRRRVLPPRGHVARTYGLPKARGPRVTLLQAIHPARVGVRLAEAALRARKRPPAGRP
jgi:hypothetical protein